MNPSLKERISRKLDTLPDERAYQILDYIEFLESKYAERQAPPPNLLQRFSDGVEDTLRAGRVSAGAIAQTMSLMNQAMGVLNGVTAAGKSVANDLVTTAQQITTNPLAKPPAAPPAPGGTPPAAGTPPSVPPANPPATPPEP
jgi:hypothetical protein